MWKCIWGGYVGIIMRSESKVLPMHWTHCQHSLKKLHQWPSAHYETLHQETATFKEAEVIAFDKKPILPDCLKTYHWPVLNIFFVSKITEIHVAERAHPKPTLKQLIKMVLGCCENHSSETAPLCVSSDTRSHSAGHVYTRRDAACFSWLISWVWHSRSHYHFSLTLNSLYLVWLQSVPYTDGFHAQRFSIWNNISTGIGSYYWIWSCGLNWICTQYWCGLQ